MCKVVYQRKHEYETIWFDQSVSSVKGYKYKRESNCYDLINSNEIQLYKNGIKEKLWNAKCFETSKYKASQYDIRYQKGLDRRHQTNRCRVYIETIS